MLTLKEKQFILFESPEVYDISEEETRFIRTLFEDLQLNLDFVRYFEIQTDPLDFSRFLILTIRYYNTFKDHDLLEKSKKI